jgi:hypothetical protein
LASLGINSTSNRSRISPQVPSVGVEGRYTTKKKTGQGVHAAITGWQDGCILLPVLEFKKEISSKHGDVLYFAKEGGFERN